MITSIHFILTILFKYVGKRKEFSITTFVSPSENIKNGPTKAEGEYEGCRMKNVMPKVGEYFGYFKYFHIYSELYWSSILAS